MQTFIMNFNDFMRTYRSLALYQMKLNFRASYKVFWLCMIKLDVNLVLENICFLAKYKWNYLCPNQHG